MRTEPPLPDLALYPDPMIHIGRFRLRCDLCHQGFSSMSRRRRICRDCEEVSQERRARS